MSEEELTEWYCKVPLKMLKKHADNIPFDLFLKLSETKIVKIGNAQGEVEDAITRYSDRGVECIYARKEDYVTFINSIREGLQSKFFDSSVPVEETVNELDGCHQVVKESLVKLGLNEEGIELAKQVADKSLQMLHHQPSIFNFFKDFQGKCSKEFLNNSLVSYTASCILETFEWASDQIKERVALAVMLRDVLLEEEDFTTIRSKEKRKDMSGLNERIIEHPTVTAELLETGDDRIFSIEVLTIIREHHEKPGGIAFPLRLTHSKINLLSAIVMISDDFIQMMNELNFDLNKKDQILQELELRYEKTNLRKAYEGLEMMLGG